MTALGVTAGSVEAAAPIGTKATRAVLAAAIRHRFPGRIAVVSSFGAESAVLLHLVAGIAPATPVIFLDTGKLFAETQRYRDLLVRRLGLADVRTVIPDPTVLARHDPDGMLWRTDPDACCHWRKVEPLDRALAGFAAWINGRKRFHGMARTELAVTEMADGRVKINPLTAWTAAAIDAYFVAHDLPRHPLFAEGYRSIGCMPCTDRVAADEDVRAGRWRGCTKTECGIHLLRPAIESQSVGGATPTEEAEDSDAAAIR